MASPSRTRCFIVITEEHSQILTLIFGAATCAACLVLLAFKRCVKTFIFQRYIWYLPGIRRIWNGLQIYSNMCIRFLNIINQKLFSVKIIINCLHSLMRAVLQQNDSSHSCPLAVCKLDQDYWGKCERNKLSGSHTDSLRGAGGGSGVLCYNLVTSKLINAIKCSKH